MCSIIHGTCWVLPEAHRGCEVSLGLSCRNRQVTRSHRPTHFRLISQRTDNEAKASVYKVSNYQLPLLNLCSDLFQDDACEKSMSHIFIENMGIVVWWNNMAQVHHWHENDTVAEGYRWPNAPSGSHVGFLQFLGNSWRASNKMFVSHFLCS